MHAASNILLSTVYISSRSMPLAFNDNCVLPKLDYPLAFSCSSTVGSDAAALALGSSASTRCSAFESTSEISPPTAPSVDESSESRLAASIRSSRLRIHMQAKVQKTSSSACPLIMQGPSQGDWPSTASRAQLTQGDVERYRIDEADPSGWEIDCLPYEIGHLNCQL